MISIKTWKKPWFGFISLLSPNGDQRKFSPDDVYTSSRD